MTTTMTAPMPDVWDGVTEVAALTAAIGKAQSAHAATSGRAFSSAQHAADLAEHLAAGGDIPAALGARLYDDVHAVEAAGLARQALWTAQDILKGQLADVKQQHADTALAVLAAELRQVVAEVRGLEPQLCNVSTADEAIATGRADDWSRLVACAARHGEIRGEQHRVLIAAGVDRAAVAPLIAKAGRIANALDVEPLRTRIATGETVPDPAPAYGGASTAYVRWLASPRVEAWVPALDQLRAAAAEQDRAVADADHQRAVDAGTAGPAAQLRDRIVHRQRADQLSAR